MRIEHWFYTVPLRLRSLFRRGRVEQDLDEELQDHLERTIQELVARGLTARQARQAAMRAMDGLTQRKEECRDMRHINSIENTLQDIRYSLRILARSPAFTIAAVVTLALAIGSNAVVFSVVNALILRPLPVARAESLYRIERASDRGANESYPNYLDLRDRNRSFESLAAINMTEVGLDTGDSPSRVWIYETSGNYFDTLDIQPYLGRFFHASDEHGPNSAPYAVLTYACWHNRFADDPGVVGRVVRLNKRPFTVVGVAPPGFHGTIVFFHPDFFTPIANNTDSIQSARGDRSVAMIGHLKVGATPAQAIADLNSIGADLERTFPNEAGQMKFTLAREGLGGDTIGPPMQAFVAGLMLLAGLILLAACANLGSLFAARTADRSKEVALRLALGSSPMRVLRRLFTEALLISLLGGAVGVGGSVVLLRGLSAWQPIARYPLHMPVNPDANVYAVALLLTLASGLLFGAVPVRQILRTNPYQVVKSGSAAGVGQRPTVRDLLLVTQIAICAVLVTSSMVAVRGLARSLHDHFGFDPRNTTLLDTDLFAAGYRGERVPAMQKRMIDAMTTIPGVESVGLADAVPLSFMAGESNVFSDQTSDLRPSSAAAHPTMFRVSPEYFQAAGTALLSGRAFNWQDDQNSPRAAVVNREFALKIFGSASQAVGRYFKMPDGTRIEVVGIAEDGRYNFLTEDPAPAMFLPILQSPSSATWLVVRSSRDPQQLAPAMRSAIRQLDAELPVFIQTWDRGLEGVLFGPRMATISLGVLGVMGAMLTVTGIFGMAAYSVSRRMKELGVRIALGAERQEVLRAALGRALKLLAFGSAAGLLLGILASQVLASIVYLATPRDPLVLAGAVLVMLLLGLLATWIPAQRALSLDPLTLLREE